jgi:outer membrane protein assembly factor BamB
MTLDEERRYLPYGRSASPLIAGDLVIVTGGGPPNGRKISLLAYDKGTGAPVWQGGESQISCCSPAFAALAGADQVLVVNENSASGHDLRTGRVLWETEWPGRSNADASVSQVVPVPPDCVFLSKGYGVGAALFQLVPAEDGRFSLKELWRNRNVLRTKFTNVTLRDGYVYGLSDGILECVELKTGRCVWHDGRYLHGQILRVEDLLLVLSERGDLFLVEATPERPNHVLGRLPALRGKTWNTMALYGPDLLARNAEEAVCVRVPLMLPAMGEERTRGTLQNPE